MNDEDPDAFYSRADESNYMSEIGGVHYGCDNDDEAIFDDENF